MSKIRISTLLSADTISKVKAEAKEKSISESAVIRQKVEAYYKRKDFMDKNDLLLIDKLNKYKPQKP